MLYLIHVSEGQSDQALSVYLHQTNMTQMKIFKGDCVAVSGKRKRQFIKVVLTNNKQQIGKVQMSAITRFNLNIKVGEKVIVKTLKELPENLKKVHVLPFQNPLLQKNIDFVKKFLVPYFKDSYRSIKVGERLSITSQNETLEFKVIACQPANYGIVIPSTVLYTQGDPILEENQERLEGIYFDDFGGYTDKVAALTQQIQIALYHPEVHRTLALRNANLILLAGPSGVGKTLLCKAISYQMEAYHFWLNCREISSMMSKIKGEAENCIRRAFEAVCLNAPSILFLDEIDKITQSKNVFDDVENRIKCQLIALIDDLQLKRQVVVVGVATDRSKVDPNLLKYGRFNTAIHLDEPNEQERYQILKIHTDKLSLHQNVDLRQIAKASNHLVGADLATLCHKAALATFQAKKDTLNLKDKSANQKIMKDIKIQLPLLQEILSDIIQSKVKQLCNEVAMFQKSQPIKHEYSEEQQIRIIKNELSMLNRSHSLRFLDKLIDRSDTLQKLASRLDQSAKDAYLNNASSLLDSYRLAPLLQKQDAQNQTHLQLRQLPAKVASLEVQHQSLQRQLKELSQSIPIKVASIKQQSNQITKSADQPQWLREYGKVSYELLVDSQEFFEDCMVYLKYCELTLNNNKLQLNQSQISELTNNLCKLKSKIVKRSKQCEDQLSKYRPYLES